MKRQKPHHALAVILLACSAPLVCASTTLTFATTGGVGVTANSGGPVFPNNTNTAMMLPAGAAAPYTATVSYGSNVSASSADNGAYVVNGTGTPDIALLWASDVSTVPTNVIEGIGPLTAGWGTAPASISNNGVGQLNDFRNGGVITVTFTPAAGKAVFIRSLDFYKSGLSLEANKGIGVRLSIAGNAQIPTTYSGDFAVSAVTENISTFSFGGGLLGRPGEALVLTLNRPAAAVELPIIKSGLGSAFTSSAAGAQFAIDNLTFSEVPEADFATDTDGDGLADILEVNNYRSNPNSTDSDGDGIPDFTEVTVTKTNPAVSNAGAVSYLVGRAAGAPVVQRNAQTGALNFRLDVQQSGDLASWLPLPLNGGPVTTTPSTDLNIGITGETSNKHFYRFKLNH